MQKAKKDGLKEQLIDHYLCLLMQCLQDEDYIRDLAKRGKAT